MGFRLSAIRSFLGALRPWGQRVVAEAPTEIIMSDQAGDLLRRLCHPRDIPFMKHAMALANRELFGNSPEASVALRMIRDGAGPKEVADRLGTGAMALLVREQKEITKDILAYGWRGDAVPNFATLYDEAVNVYGAIRR